MVIPAGFHESTVERLMVAWIRSERVLFQRYYYLITPLTSDGKGTVFRRVYDSEVKGKQLYLLVGSDRQPFEVTYETAVYWVDPIEPMG